MRKLRLLTLLVAFAVALPSFGAVVFSIQRIDDRTAVIGGSGTMGPERPDFNGHLIVLDEPFAEKPQDVTYVFESSTMSIGGKPVDFAYQAAALDWFDVLGNRHPTLYFGNSGFIEFNVGDAVTGELRIQLSGPTTLAEVGTMGGAFWGAFGRPVDAGNWAMATVDDPSSVPEPLSLALVGIALAGLLVFHRAKSA